MCTAASLVLLAAGLAGAAEPSDKPPYQALSSVKAAAEASPFPGKSRLLKAVEDARSDAARLPPEKRDAAVERHIPSINASAYAAEDAPLNDALAGFNNSAGRFAEAARFADRALEADPKSRSALIQRSTSRIGLNRLEEAYADADRAVSLDPGDAAALRARAMAAYKLRRFVEAEQDARRAVALDPNDRAAFYIMQLAGAKVPALKLDKLQSQLAGEVQREYHGMVQQLNQAAERARQPAPEPAPAAVEAHVKTAAAKINIRDFAAAIAAADKAVTADPQNASAYYYRAAANNLAGRFEQAAADATRALMLDPSDVRARDARAWAYNSLGRFRDAIADANHSLEIHPENAYAYWNLGYAREHVGDLQGMLGALKAAAKLSPQFEPAYRDAAARHGLSDAETAPKAKPAEASRARRRSFAVVVLSSVIGGLLIAAGFLQLYGDTIASKEKAGPVLPNLESSYTLGRSLGAGGMGVVYEAVDKALQRKVAVKVMKPETLKEPRARERFIEEARTVAALHHPAIIDIHAVVEDKEGLCLVFEHLEGETLEQLLRRRGRLSLTEARSLLKPVCQGLEFAHQRGVVHRDLKPSNIMITAQGLVKLMDFGISRHEDGTPSKLSAVERASARGTPHYMAPEQECGEVRRESDVYSLGACLYEMLTGERPFPAPHAMGDKLGRHYTPATKLVPSLPPAVDQLVDAALHPDPRERIKTPAEFLAGLERITSRSAAATA